MKKKRKKIKKHFSKTDFLEVDCDLMLTKILEI